MSIQFGDILQHNNLLYPIVDINDVKGGLRSIATFSSPALVSEYASIPEKYRSGYSLLLETSTGTIYYLAGIDPTNVSHWSPVGIGGNGYGVTNTIPKWTSSSILGNSNITDNGDTVTISGNLMVIGTTSTISTENLLVKDPIILLAGSQSGTPTYDAGLFVNRGSSTTQAFIWDESEKEFKFISTTSGATTSGNVSIGTYSNVRTGVLSVGTGTSSNSRFLVSSSGGTNSLIVDEDGNVYNISRGISNTLFGYQTGLLITGTDNTTIGYQSLYVNTTGYYNTAVGSTSMRSNLIGFLNTAIGYQSLYENSSGNFNTAIGASSLLKNLSGSYNTAIGASSLLDNRFGTFNIGVGANSLRYNRGSFNTAIGYNSSYLNTIGTSNTAVGYQSLYNNTSVINTFGTITPGSGYVPGTYTNVQLIYATGSAAVSYPKADIVVDGSGVVVSVIPGNNLGSGFPDSTTKMTISNSFLGGSGSGFEVGIGSLSTGNNNTGIGFSALLSNTTGGNNTSVGQSSLDSNSTGSDNTAVGQGSLQSNTTGNYNTAVGKFSMYYNTTGDSNIGIGWQALPNNTTGYQNTGIGRNSLFNSRTGVLNTAFGDAALYFNTSGSFHTGLGLEAGLSSTTGVSVLGTFSSGSGYTPGTYSGVLLKYSSGSQVLGGLPDYYPVATIVVGTGGTISSVTLETSGKTFGTSSTTIMGNTIYPLSIVDGGPGYTASSTFSNVPLSYISGGTAATYPVVTVYTGPGGTVSSVTIVTNGSGFQDNTTIMGADLGTGTFSVKAAANSIGPGTGFTIRVASLQTAQSNTAVGFKSLYYNTIGSNNVSLGHEAGNFTITTPYFNYISDNSVYIGYYARAKNSNETNQIVIGYDAYGNGSNTVTLGNDSITKTYLKGNIQLPTIPTTSIGTYSILTRNDITGEIEKIVVTPYKVYTALLTQSGTASPTAIVLENTLGVTITFSYGSPGVYSLTATGALTINKTWVIFNNVDNNAGTIAYNGKGLNGFTIQSRNSVGTTANDLLNLTEIEIRVYN